MCFIVVLKSSPISDSDLVQNHTALYDRNYSCVTTDRAHCLHILNACRTQRKMPLKNALLAFDNDTDLA